MSSQDEELHTLFEDLRAVDTARAPAFATFSREAERDAQSPATPRTRGVWLFLAAASVVIAASLFLYQSRPDVALSDEVLASGILSWTSPTDGLLQIAPATTASPSTFGSVLDGAAAPVVQPDSTNER